MRSAALLLILSACGGPKRVYEGPKLPPNETCLVVIEGGMIDEECRWEARLLRFDGVPARKRRTRVETLPGEHHFDIAWTRSRLLRGGRPTWTDIDSGAVEMTFELREGFRYVLSWIGGDQPLRFRERPLEP